MIRWLTFVLLHAFPLTAAPSFQWQPIEIIGATDSQRIWIQNNFDSNMIVTGEEQFSIQAATFCQRLKKQFGAHLNCEVVGFPDGNVHFVLSMQRDDAPAFVNLRKTAVSESQVQEADTVLQCVPTCNDPAIRINAWNGASVKYSPQQVCEIAADLLFDSLVELRNLAGQYINHQFTTCSNVLHAERLAKQLNRLLYRPFHTDRNKSIATLMLLLPILSDCAVTKLRADWQWLAEQSILPNVGDIARQMLEQSMARQCLIK